VLAQKRKNVHAYAVGTFTTQQAAGTEAVSYCPYTAAHFYRKSDLSPVYTAQTAFITNGTVFI
jgi:hypothetical protein